MIEINPEGYYVAFSYWLSASLYIMLNPKKKEGFKRVLNSSAFLALLIVFTLVTDTDQDILFWPTLLSVLGIVYLYIHSNCDCPALNKVYFLIRSFVLGEFLVSLEWLVYSFVLTEGYLAPGIAGEILVFLAVYVAAFWCIYFFERNFSKFNAKMVISKKEALTALIIAFAVFGFSNVGNLVPDTPFGSQLPFQIMFVKMLIDMEGFVILFAYHMQIEDLGNRRELEMLRQMMEVQYANYCISKQSIDIVSRKYHDLKHQIALLRSEISNEEKLEYLGQMEREIKCFEVTVNTGNQVVDTILTAKNLQCQNQEIQLTNVVDGSCLGFMEPMDISALLGNALDNAIESVLKIEEPKKRLIHVSLSEKKGFIVFYVGNAYVGEIVFHKGLPQTDKKDRLYHGFGTKSIQDVAMKYGGAVTFGAKDGWFEMKAVIPANQDKKAQ